MSEAPARPILRMPLKNFKIVGELTEQDVEWWREFGRHLEAAHRDWDSRLPKREIMP